MPRWATIPRITVPPRSSIAKKVREILLLYARGPFDNPQEELYGLKLDTYQSSIGAGPEETVDAVTVDTYQSTPGGGVDQTADAFTLDTEQSPTANEDDQLRPYLLADGDGLASGPRPTITDAYHDGTDITVVVDSSNGVLPDPVELRIYRTDTRGGTFTEITSISNPSDTETYTDTTVSSGKTYYYVATTVSSDGLESRFSNEVAIGIGVAEFTVTVRHQAIDSPLTDFPVYFDLSEAPQNFWANVASDGSDIRVYGGDGNPRPRQVVWIDAANNQGAIYFLATSLSDTQDTEFFIEAGTGDPAPAPTDPNGRNEVWRNGFHRVFHFNEDPSGGPLTDATGGFAQDWSYRKKITVQSSEVPSDLTDFPVYVDLSTLGSNFFNNVQADGADIRVTTANGTTLVPREVVEIDTGAETGELHFKAPSLSGSSDTEFYIYYGNSNAEHPVEWAENGPENVWSRYDSVYHGGGRTDSAGDNDGTAGGGVTHEGVNGQMGSATDFDGTDDRFEGQSWNGLFDGNNDFTIELWFDVASFPVDQDPSNSNVALQTRGENNFFVQIGDNSPTDELSVRAEFSSSSWTTVLTSGTLNLDQLYDVAIAYDANNGWAMRLDGAQVSSSTLTESINSDTGYSNAIGALIDGGNPQRPWEGLLDEIRVSRERLPDDFQSARYTNQDSPGTFYAVGSEQSVAEDLQNNNATVNGGMGSGDLQQGDGYTGSRWDFDATDDWVQLPINFRWDALSDWTMDVVFEIDNQPSSTFYDLLRGSGVDDVPMRAFKDGADIRMVDGTGTEIGSNAYGTGAPEHFVANYNQSQNESQLFSEGVPGDSGTLQWDDGGFLDVFRKNGSDPEWGDGKIEEIRISTVERSDDWIEARWYNLDQLTRTFLQVESEPRTFAGSGVGRAIGNAAPIILNREYAGQGVGRASGGGGFTRTRRYEGQGTGRASGTGAIDTFTEQSVTVTVQSSKVASDLTSFPLYIDLADMPQRFWDNVDVDGDWIEVDDGGGNEIPREVSWIDRAAQEGSLYVRRDLSSSSDTTVTVRVKPGASKSPGDPNGRNAVWSNGYHRVYHFATDPASGLIDSTGGADATVNGGMSDVDLTYGAGRTGSRWNFDGVDDWVQIPMNYFWGSGNDFTFMAIAEPDVLANNWYDLVQASDQDDTPLRLSSGGIVRAFDDNTFLDGPSFFAGRPNSFDVTYEGGGDTTTIYSEAAGGQTRSDLPWTDGGDVNVFEKSGGDWGDGKIEELRVSTVERSADWIETRYKNFTDSSFYQV